MAPWKRAHFEYVNSGVYVYVFSDIHTYTHKYIIIYFYIYIIFFKSSLVTGYIINYYRSEIAKKIGKKHISSGDEGECFHE